MKKISAILAGALVVGTTAGAVVIAPEVATQLQSEKQDLTAVKEVKSENAVLATSNITRAGETVGEATVKSPLLTFTLGHSTSGYAYSDPIGFLPSFGKVKFEGVAEGATSYEWSWNNGFNTTSQYYKEFTATTADNEISLTPGEMISNLTFTAKNGDASSVAAPLSSLYLMGATPTYYGLIMKDETYAFAGLYPCVGYKNGTATGTRVNFMAYSKNASDAADFDSNGTYKEWPEALAVVNKGDAANYKNVVVDSYAYLIPEQSSAYMFDSMVAWMNCGFSAETVLEGHVYPVVENVIQDKAIARLTANVKKADVGGVMLVYSVIPLDEDGDDIEGKVVVDNAAICIKLEKFASNDKVITFTPVFGNGTVFPKDAQCPWFTNSYISLQYNEGDQTKRQFLSCPYNYWQDKAMTTLLRPANYFWSINAAFPYVLNENGTQDFLVTVPTTGGNEVVKANAYYYNLKALVAAGMMEAESDSDWLTFNIGDANTETGETQITVSASPLPAGTKGRWGMIKFTGYAQDFTINVSQGDTSGVGEIAVDSNVETVYFDLQGRKLNGAPEKGLYLVKEGNKVTKVIR